MDRSHRVNVSFVFFVALLVLTQGAFGCSQPEDTGQRSTPLDYENDYCDMEASCIPLCNSSAGYVPCTTKARSDYCHSYFQEWVDHFVMDGPDCVQSLMEWMGCVTTASCADVETFFRRFPDDLQPGDPCATEYLQAQCNNFEPLTEYEFDVYPAI